MAIDYYDRIADALEVISGDDSHVDDVSPTMDYYDRIANALEIIAQNGVSVSNQSGIVYAIITAEPTQVENVYTYNCDKTLEELLAAIEAGSFVIAKHGNTYSPLSGYSDSQVIFQNFSMGLTNISFNIINVGEDSVTVTEKEIVYNEGSNDNQEPV